MGAKLNSVPLKNVQIKDGFWNRYIDLVKDVIIPYQWDMLNDAIPDAAKSYCIHNFKVAAGDIQGERQGMVFQDSDVGKWLEAVAYTVDKKRDPDLEAVADAAIDLIGRAQEPDGYLNTYFTVIAPEQKWKDLCEGHELYTAGHLIEAAVAYYEATGKDKLLQIMSRFADVICDKFGPGEEQLHGYPGHQEIELALVKLYRVTGKKEYLDTAKYFIDRRGVGENYFLWEEKQPGFQRIFPEFVNYDPKYSQSHVPVREQDTAEGHAVRAVYMYCAMADLAYEYQDDTLLKACEKLWNNIVGKRMYITGSIGSSGILERFTTDYDLPNDTNYSETCATIGLALFGKRMAEITRDGKYVDVVEKALYNTLLSGIAMDGKSFFYVNPLEVWPENCLPRTAMEHIKPVRQKWFGVACCPPNIARTLASMGQYMYSTCENTLYVNLYIANETAAELANGTMNVALESRYPDDGCMKFTVKQAGAGSKVAFRIPGYVKEFSVLKNGQAVDTSSVEKGYLYVDAASGDVFELNFQIPARFVRANTHVRADAGKVALVKGPLVYCLEEQDNGKDLASIYVDTHQSVEETYEEDLLGGITTLRFAGKKLKDSQGDALYVEEPAVLEDVSVKAVPYFAWCNRTPGEMLVWMKEILG